MNKTFVKIVLLNIILLPVLLSLSHWQWQRAKSAELKLQKLNQLNQQAPLTTFNRQWQNFAPVELSGTLLQSRSFLLNNQTLNSQPGYHLITPIELASAIVLINRGWVAAHSDTTDIGRRDMPATVRGALYKLRLPTVNRALDSIHPIVIEDFDIEKIQKKFVKPLSPFLVYLDDESPFGKRIQRPFSTISPAKNYSYMLQWLLFALVLITTSIYFMQKNKK